MDESNPYYDTMFARDKKVVDDKAYSVEAIARELGLGQTQAARYCRNKVESGEWEKVWKHGTKFLIPAYRPKQ